MNSVDKGAGWISSPIYLTTDDEIKIRWMGGWDENRGGEVTALDTPFTVTAGGPNMKVPTNGMYVVAYVPETEEIAITSWFWGLIGDFNGWSGDVFMMYRGNGEWVAYDQTLPGGWKIRQGCSWDVNRGGTFVEAGTPFDAVPGGDNINVGDLTGFTVIYNQENETITVVK